MARQMKILVLDDHPEELNALLKNLEESASADPQSFGACKPRFEQAGDAAEIVARIGRSDCPWDVIVADVFMPSPDDGIPDPEHGAVSIYWALEGLAESRRPFLIMTSNRWDDVGSLLTPLVQYQRSLDEQWADFLIKPANAPLGGRESVLLHVEAWKELVRNAIRSHSDLCWKRNFVASGLEEVATISPALQSLKADILRCADQYVVAVLGGPGSGKDVVARSLHEASARRKSRFVAHNCGSGARDLVEAELFGAKRGAYTGCNGDRMGKIQACGTGTLFLDEFGSDLQLAEQIDSRLRRLMSATRDFTRMGDENNPQAFKGAIVIAGSHLAEILAKAKTDIKWQQFRSRISAVISVPPLQGREKDILTLARHFLNKVCTMLQYPMKRLSPAATQALCKHSWPGNIRELENTMRRAAMALKLEIDATDLEFDFADSVTGDAECAEPDFKTAEGMRCLLKRHGTQNAVAAAVKRTSRTIEMWMRRHRAKDEAFLASYPPRQSPPSP